MSSHSKIKKNDLVLVVAGSTLGMMLVNGPAVLLGEAPAPGEKLPVDGVVLVTTPQALATMVVTKNAIPRNIRTM